MRPGLVFLTALAGAGLSAVFAGSAVAGGWGCGSCGYYPAGQVYYAAPTYSYAPPTVTVVPHYIVQPNYIVRRTYVIRQDHYINEAPACGPQFGLAALFGLGSSCGGVAVAPQVSYEGAPPAYYSRYSTGPRYVAPRWRHYRRYRHRVYVGNARRHYRYGAAYRVKHYPPRHRHYQPSYYR